MRKFYLLLVALICAFTANADTLAGGRIWFEKGTMADWVSGDGCVLTASFNTGDWSTGVKVPITEENGTMYCDIPAGNWTKVTVYRKCNSGNYDQQTADLQPAKKYKITLDNDNGAGKSLVAISNYGAAVGVLHNGNTVYYNSTVATADAKTTYEIPVPFNKNDQFWFLVDGKYCSANDDNVKYVTKSTSLSFAKNSANNNFVWNDNAGTYTVKFSYSGDNPHTISFTEVKTTTNYDYYLKGPDNWTYHKLTPSNGVYTSGELDLKSSGSFLIERRVEGGTSKEAEYQTVGDYTVVEGTPFTMKLQNDGGNTNPKFESTGKFTFTFNPSTGEALFSGTGNTGGDTKKMYYCLDPGTSSWEYGLEMKAVEGQENTWKIPVDLKAGHLFMIATEQKTSASDYWATGKSYILGIEDYKANDKYYLQDTDSKGITSGNGKPFYIDGDHLRAAAYTLTITYDPSTDKYSMQLSENGGSGDEDLPASKLDMVNGKPKYYLQGDINGWSSPVTNCSNSKTELTPAENNGTGRALYYLTKEEIENWRFSLVDYSTESPEVTAVLKTVNKGVDWIKLDMRKLTDRNGHKGRLCGQYHFIQTSYGDLQPRWNDVDVVPGKLLNLTYHNKTSNNIRNKCNYIQDAVIYFNPIANNGNGVIYVTGTEKEIYFYYTDRSNPAQKPTYLAINAKADQPNYNLNMDDENNVSVDDFKVENIESEPVTAVYTTSSGRKITLDNVWRIKIPNSTEHRFPGYFNLTASGKKETVTTTVKEKVTPLYITTDGNGDSDGTWDNVNQMYGGANNVYYWPIKKGAFFKISTTATQGKDDWQNSANWLGVANSGNDVEVTSSYTDVKLSSSMGKCFTTAKLNDGNYLVVVTKKDDGNYYLTVKADDGSGATKCDTEYEVTKTTESEPITIRPEIVCDDVWMIETAGVNVYFRYANDHKPTNVKANVYWDERDDSGKLVKRNFVTGAQTTYKNMDYVEAENIVIDEAEQKYAPYDATEHGWYKFPEKVTNNYALTGNAIFVATDDQGDHMFPVNGINASDIDLAAAAIKGTDLWYVVPREIEAHLLYTHRNGSYETNQGAIHVQGEVWVDGQVDVAWMGKYTYDFKIYKTHDAQGNEITPKTLIKDDDDLWIPYMVEADNDNDHACSHVNEAFYEPFKWTPDAGTYQVILTVTENVDENSNTVKATDTQEDVYVVYEPGQAPDHKFYIESLECDRSTRKMTAKHKNDGTTPAHISWVKWQQDTNNPLNPTYGDDETIRKNNGLEHTCANFGNAYYRVYAEAMCECQPKAQTMAIQDDYVEQMGPVNADTRVARTLYVADLTTEIEDILAEKADTDAPVEYFNLQGVRVINPTPGQVVIRRQGTQITKVIVR